MEHFAGLASNHLELIEPVPVSSNHPVPIAWLQSPGSNPPIPIGAYHFQSATAEADEELFDWATAYGQSRLQLHGPTEWNRRRLFKTWYDVPAHHAVS